MISQSEKRSAKVLRGKTARPCDSCLRRRARWYCAADDAFLCQGCDSSVHSANPLARRHERLRLNSSSLSSLKPAADADPSQPSWHKGFKRKARTPRSHHHHARTKSASAQLKAASAAAAKSETLVPDLETSTSLDENPEKEAEQLLYRVPIFDPLFAEFCSIQFSDTEERPATTVDAKSAVQLPLHASSAVTLPGFLQSDIDLSDFAADVDSLLGRGLDQDAFCMEGLGLTGSTDVDFCLGGRGVKVETPDGGDEDDNDDLVVAGITTPMYHLDGEMDSSRETLDLNFDCGSPMTGEDEEEEEEEEEGEEEKAAPAGAAATGMDGYGEAAAVGSRKVVTTLRLDYEAVIDTWTSTQGCSSSPWTDGERPHFNLHNCWPDYMGMISGEAQGVVCGGGGGGGGGHAAVGYGGREARVSRYREKRRTRLFAKKIRYEVRKLNAEKRPRMKGRFVKRASFVAAAAGVGVAPPPAFAF